MINDAMIEIEEGKPLNLKFRYSQHLFNSSGIFERIGKSTAVY